MKNLFRFVLAAMAIASAASCAKELAIEEPQAEAQVAEGFKMITLEANMDDALTKSYLADDLKVNWDSECDSIAVFDGVTATPCVFKLVSVDGTTAKFAGAIAETATTLYAVHPFSAYSSVTATEDSLTVSIPTAQVLKAGRNVAPNALVSVAKAGVGENLTFKNAVSLIKFNIASDDVKGVVITGAEATEGIAGTIKVGLDGASIAGAASTRLTVYPAEGSEVFAQGTYYAAVAPCTLPAGICIAASGDALSLNKTDKAVSLKRNGGINAGTITNGSIKVPAEIKTRAELELFAANATYYTTTSVVKLGADIDLEGKAWTRAERYYGSFDGQNHRIYNIVSSNPSGVADDAGVFGRVGYGNASYPYYFKNIVFGSKDYDFQTGKGTYDGVSKITYDAPNNGSDTYFYPGAICYCYAYGTFENLVNFMDVEITDKCTTPHRAAPLLGTCKSNVTVRNCVNYGNLTDATVDCTKKPTVAGISGGLDGDGSLVEHCFNYGNITTSGTKIESTAGIVPFMKASTVTNCANCGTITLSGVPAQQSYVSGVVASVTGAGTLNYTVNAGAVKVQQASKTAYQLYIAGVAASVTGAAFVDNNLNKGEITTEGEAIQYSVGGIVARNVTAIMASFKENENYGTITNKMNTTDATGVFVGGVIARVHQASTIDSCKNFGKVTDLCSTTISYLGGVVGYNQATSCIVKNCKNEGSVEFGATSTKTSYCGGVLGYAKNGITMDSNTNSGEVKVVGNLAANLYIAGVVGRLDNAKCTATKCINTGKVTGVSNAQTLATAISVVGGITGNCSGTLTECENSGELAFNADCETPSIIWGGGIQAGNATIGTMTGCKNSGTINIGKLNAGTKCYFGGVIGRLTTAAKISDCSSTGAITATQPSANLYIGGVVGYTETASAAKESLEGCSASNVITVDATTLPFTGMLVGLFSAGNTAAFTLGTAANPVKLGGSINGTAVSAENLATMAVGSGSAASENNVINVALAQ